MVTNSTTTVDRSATLQDAGRRLTRSLVGDATATHAGLVSGVIQWHIARRRKRSSDTYLADEAGRHP
jgi:hypothetical protein